MAIEVNNKLLNLALDTEGNPVDVKDPHVKFFYECVKRIHKVVGDKVSLLLTDIHKKYDNYSNQWEHGTVLWNYMETIQRKGISETWKIYDTKKDMGVNKPAVYERRSKLIAGGGLTFAGNNNLEQMFFMVFISPNCEKIENLSDLQNPKDNVRKDWYVDNAIAKIEKETKMNELKADVSHFIYRVADDSTLRSIAGYGDLDITGSSQMDLKELKNAIYNRITNDPKLMAGFKPDKYSEDTQKIRVLLNSLQDENLMQYNKTFRRFEFKENITDLKWQVMYKVPKEIPTNMVELNTAFVKFLKNNPDEVTKLENNLEYHMKKKELANA